MLTDIDLTELFARVRSKEVAPQRHLVCRATPHGTAAYQYSARPRQKIPDSFGWINQLEHAAEIGEPDIRWLYRAACAGGKMMEPREFASMSEWCKIVLDVEQPIPVPFRADPRYALLASVTRDGRVVIVPGTTQPVSAKLPNAVIDDSPAPELVVEYVPDGTTGSSRGATGFASRFQFVEIWGTDYFSVHDLHASVDRGSVRGWDTASEAARQYVRDVLGLSGGTPRAWLSDEQAAELRARYRIRFETIHRRLRQGCLVPVRFTRDQNPILCAVVSDDALHALRFRDGAHRCVVAQTVAIPRAEYDDDPGEFADLVPIGGDLFVAPHALRGIRITPATVPAGEPPLDLAKVGAPSAWDALRSKLRDLHG